MGFPIKEKLVVAISTNALFDYSEAHRVYVERGLEEYTKFQKDHSHTAPPKGTAFPFIERLLWLNKKFPREQPVEVVILSRNHSSAGQRSLNALEEYGLNISRAAFLAGGTPYPYMKPYGASLYLSTNVDEVKTAVAAGYPAGVVLPCGTQTADEDDGELRIAFDFDGIIADDEAERVYVDGGLPLFHLHEEQKRISPLRSGPLYPLIKKINEVQKLEMDSATNNKSIIRTSIITSRNAPAHERLLTTIENLGIKNDEVIFLGGIDKAETLDVLRPHIFFDDQLQQLEVASSRIPCVHIPFGVRNLN